MNDTDDFTFKVSRSYILFPSNSTTTRTISIESECFNLGLMIKTANNLPESFITDLPRNYIDNNREIHITYRGADLEERYRPRDLFITFSDSLHSNNSHKVILEIVDAEEEFEAEVVQVEEQYGQQNPFECPICFETFTEQGGQTPIVLGKCGHTLCFDCVLKILSETKPKCPFDRKTLRKDWNQLTVKNYNLLLLMEHEKKKPKPKVTIKRNPLFVCEKTRICADPVVPCHENRRHESTCFCTSCQLDFCHNCFLKVHPQSETLGSHKIVSIYEKPVVLPMCTYHPRQPAALICKDNECTMFKEKYCWQCAHERHKHENPTALDQLMEQNKISLLQVSRQLNSQKQDYSDKFTFLKGSLARYRTAWMAGRAKARTDEEKETMDELWDTLLNKVNIELSETESKLESITKVQKPLNEVLMRKTELDDIGILMRAAGCLCISPVGEYEHLVPQPPYEFPIEDRPDEDEPVSDGDGPDLDGERLVSDEDGLVIRNTPMQQGHPIPQPSPSGSSIQNTPFTATSYVARPVPQEYTPTQLRRILGDTDPDYEAPTSLFNALPYEDLPIREERPLRYGRKRRILVEEEDE
ncbi:unnamed protein product [Caenorhabditis brenneri]